ncbi:MAG: hypothetical protein ACE5F9_01395 [Phycisphaerae bacterium]
MATWWKKLVEILRGDESDPFSSKVTVRESKQAHPDPQPNRSDSTMEISDPHTTAPVSIDPDPRIAQLIEAVEKRHAEAAERAEQTTAAIERLAASIDAMPAPGTTGNGDLPSVLQNTTEAMEQAQRVREIVATLPEIASSQVDAISSLDDHLHAVDQRVSTLRDERLQSDQVTIQVSNTQRQIARALNVLRDMLIKQAEQSRGAAAEVQGLKEALVGQHQKLRTHVTRQIETSVPRVGPATVFSIVAALAALGTLALLLIQRYG